MKVLLGYIDRPSVVHQLTGATKLLGVMLWSVAAMTTDDTRCLSA